jgi:acyl-coenzyme A synthetase/AMP-(fatty) acid ligase
MSNALVNLPDAQSYDVSSLPAFIAGGDCLPLELQHRFRQLFGVHPDEVCGMTEIMRCTARACIPATWRGAARRGADGFLWFAGRTKDIIIRGGSNTSPGEAYVALKPGAQATEADSINWTANK